MARRGGDDWNRLKNSLPLDQREELSRLNESVETLAAELKDARDAFEKEGMMRQERRRLRKPWEEARRVALDPPEEFLLATELVGLLHSEPTRKFRTKELAKRLDAGVSRPAFLEAAQLLVAEGFAEWTTTGKIRTVGVARLRATGLDLDRLEDSLAKMRARLRVLRVAPLWMLHENGSAESTPTEFQTVLSQLILRQDGLIWAGPGIVASATVDLESLEVNQIWRPFAERVRGTAEIERDYVEARTEFREALKAAANELWAQREPISKLPAQALESSRVSQPGDARAA